MLSACQSNMESTPSVTKKSSEATPTYRYNPTAAIYNTQLGIAYLRQGEHDRAKQKLLIAEKQDPKSAMVLDAKAYFLEMTGDIQQAQSYYTKAIKLNPGMGIALNNYGSFLCRQKQFVAAEKQFLLAVKDARYLSIGEAYENAGLCAMKAQQYVKAEDYLLKALQKQPKLTSSLLSLARIYYDRKDYLAAKQYLQRFNRFGNSEPEALELAILLAEQDGDPNTIQTNLANLGKLFPDSSEYQKMREHYG